MFIIWRKFVVWLRSILLAYFNKTPINWDKKIDELGKILNETTKKLQDKQLKIDDKPVITLEIEPNKPIYDIVPQRKRLIRKLIDRLFND